MSFKSLNHILGVWENQVESQIPWQSFQCLLKCWTEVVGVAVSLQTRPVAIQGTVLWVATSSGVWAEELKFKRQAILKKLNAQLPISLSDIRFSTAKWQNGKTEVDSSEVDLWKDHPSRVVDVPVKSSVPQSSQKNPQAVFQNWAESMQARSQSLPLCPQCQSPTPPGELQRWGVCAICATKQWSIG